ncbi:hypothetical protein QVD17_37156 [Tagetes erecta]|uniref:Uncharacterized protein n=1 Tax=Tagetes erecta TaxID=13708 RepID=A0AAD8JTR1_TARER|nr:hypothetical protein QVD17_37156 [Tagetes erecta]
MPEAWQVVKPVGWTPPHRRTATHSSDVTTPSLKSPSIEPEDRERYLSLLLSCPCPQPKYFKPKFQLPKSVDIACCFLLPLTIQPPISNSTSSDSLFLSSAAPSLHQIRCFFLLLLLSDLLLLSSLTCCCRRRPATVLLLSPLTCCSAAAVSADLHSC